MPELFLMAAIALLLWGSSRFRASAQAHATGVEPENVAARAYLDRLFGPAPASAGASRERSQ
jgi:hypothetical protein